MSAHFCGAEVKTTRRSDLGKVLGQVGGHLLLMTATPHAGNEADFQLFMALLDADRFEAQFRDGVHAVDPQGLMRRMIKEDLLTFEGKPLFPERRADTLAYDLSPAEQDLYDAVTDYVREQGLLRRNCAGLRPPGFAQDTGTLVPVRRFTPASRAPTD